MEVYDSTVNLRLLKVQHLNINKLSDGLKSLGIVIGFEGQHIIVQLPGLLKGFISATEISDILKQEVEYMLENATSGMTALPFSPKVQK